MPILDRRSAFRGSMIALTMALAPKFSNAIIASTSSRPKYIPPVDIKLVEDITHFLKLIDPQKMIVPSTAGHLADLAQSLQLLSEHVFRLRLEKYFLSLLKQSTYSDASQIDLTLGTISPAEYESWKLRSSKMGLVGSMRTMSHAVSQTAVELQQGGSVKERARLRRLCNEARRNNIILSSLWCLSNKHTDGQKSTPNVRFSRALRSVAGSSQLSILLEQLSDSLS